MKSYKYIIGTAAILTLASSCSDSFLEEKKLYGKYSYATVYSDYETAKNRVDNLYYQMLPGKKEGEGQGCDLVSTGLDDEFGKSTEEYGGISKWEDNLSVMDYMDLNGFFDHLYVVNKEISPYGFIRNINDCIEGLNDGTLDEDKKKELLGQAYFMRAWRYYLMVKWYGGVPIVDYVQNATVGNGEGLNLVIPRPSTKECIDFIYADLDRAIEMLPTKWTDPASNWGRVTSGTAAALKGRLALLWASPLFNRADDESRWEEAYSINKQALELLNEGGYGLAYEGQSGDANACAQNWAKIFLNTQGTDGTVNEAVFVTLYNKLDDQEDNSDQWNSWETNIRPKTAYGNGGKEATAEIVDLFPMADGKKASESSLTYDSLCFFKDRDPRFYRTFAFPGVLWYFDGEPKTDLTTKSKIYTYPSVTMTGDYPYNGNEYVLWSYCWYSDDEMDNCENPAKSGYAADMLGSSNKSVYVRKRSDDLQINSNCLYTYKASNSTASSPILYGFKHSAAPFMEMRFAEVLLNYAEAAAGANHTDEALEALKRIRSRVYDAQYALSNYGLVEGDRAQMLSQVLYERQIELAYEGKRFEDMRRWMLFDGGVGQENIEGATTNWKLTGFGGNTCTYLGVEPTNGHKNHSIEIYTPYPASAKQTDGVDPILTDDLGRPAGLDLNKMNTGLDDLVNFYQDNLVRKNRNADGNNDEQVPLFLPIYYFPGMCYSMMYNNATLYQTIGWEDYSHGGMGIYDPLETDPNKIPVDTDTAYKE